MVSLLEEKGGTAGLSDVTAPCHPTRKWAVTLQHMHTFTHTCWRQDASTHPPPPNSGSGDFRKYNTEELQLLAPCCSKTLTRQSVIQGKNRGSDLPGMGTKK